MKIICLVWLFSMAGLMAIVRKELDVRHYATLFRAAMFLAFLVGLILF